MPNVIIYHNPRCSKSRQTMELLLQHDITPTIVEYLKVPPNVNELKHILNLLGISARELIRQKEPLYQEKKLNNPSLSEDELIKAMTQHPILIERPIVFTKTKAVIGRPPENVLSIITPGFSGQARE